MDNILEIEDIHVRIADAYVLQGISFDIPKGELVALLGRNGAGKTTTLESILGINSIFKGQIRFGGEDITGLQTFEVAKKGIGYVPDSARIFSELTVEENLKMGMLHKESQEKIKEIYELFPFLKKYEQHNGKALSGGEQKLLALARAMVSKEHELLLIDEPTEGLSPENSKKTYEALEKAKKRSSILLVADNLELAEKFAEKYVIMEDGQVVRKGDMKEVSDNPELAKKYLGTAV